MEVEIEIGDTRVIEEDGQGESDSSISTQMLGWMTICNSLSF